MLSGKSPTQTSSQEDSFKQLEKISTDKQIRETKSGTWATGHGINEELEKLLGDRVHIVHPDTSSISSPASCDVNSSFEGAINYAKMIGGYCVNEELIANGFIHMDGGELKKPVVMVINTDTAVVKDEKDANSINLPQLQLPNNPSLPDAFTRSSTGEDWPEWKFKALEHDMEIQGKVLLLLDGFDEIKDVTSVQRFNDRLSKTCSKTNIIITTRTYAANKLISPAQPLGYYLTLKEYNEEQHGSAGAFEQKFTVLT